MKYKWLLFAELHILIEEGNYLPVWDEVKIIDREEH